MRKLYLPFICLLFALSLHAQDRVNKPLPTLGDTIGYLDSAKGWIYHTDGQWESNDNRIPRLNKRFPSLNAYEEDGKGIDNFYYLSLQDIKIGDSTYCILLKPYKDGFYEYESIHKGWEEDTSTAFFVFSKSKLKAFSQIQSDTQRVIRIPLILYGNLKYTAGKKDIISSIAAHSVTGKAHDSMRLCIVLGAYPKKNVAQFFISEETIKAPSWGTEPIYQYDCIADGYASQSYRGSNKDIFGNTLLLKQFYYETSWDNFRKLFGAGK